MPQETAALKFVILLGFVSLCADATYEGARSITGAYLEVLGANGTLVGLIAGFGELIGYGFRLVIGYLSDQTRKYWGITTLGYFLNTAVVPFLALAGRWEVAAGLMIAERTGKAVRTPPRDALLSHGVSQMGRGFGFGLHEAMDQTGAVIGPLAVAAVIYWWGSYQNGFVILVVPAILGLLMLLVLQKLYPNPQDFEVETVADAEKGLPQIFWIYLGAVALVAAGYADFPLIAYHFQKQQIASGLTIPLFYALAMGVDAVAALIFGKLFDRIGISILMLAVVLSCLFAPLAFSGSTNLALAGMILWGVGMGAQESILKATIAGLVSKDKRASAYGIFSAGYGLAWFLGSTLMGVLYDWSITVLVVFSVFSQFMAIPFLLWVKWQADTKNNL
ncbi:MFS transporter [Chlorogloeopsis fritschii PCC 9212]|uniref:MFS transporter n=1 Tax=Chlorogloeopsis fritschii PCC 6912 TaxID=211165 RepID=A0A433NMF4_CHLFR|nr:MFS transporter [Chlorogloeopsis fritschii]MBF2005463.1 MFS transporter [Chlorogloeopsis fritschii C42_A2020_084]RUR84231.1 MFS transporter [Chlorogloeopsis fritschii PCC 6912]